MSIPKKSKPKSRAAAKAAPKAKVAAQKKQPSEALLVVVGICITFLLLVDSYYIAVLVQAHNS